MEKKPITHGTTTGRISVGFPNIRELEFNDELPEPLPEEIAVTLDPYDERQYIKDASRR
jgi:hypothetical protein